MQNALNSLRAKMSDFKKYKISHPIELRWNQVQLRECWETCLVLASWSLTHNNYNYLSCGAYHMPGISRFFYAS